MWPFRSYLLPFWNPAGSSRVPPKRSELPRPAPPHASDQRTCANRPAAVEDYRAGYPQYTALLAAHDPYFLCRRFNKLRALVLLRKQDRLSVLEQTLEKVDQQESSPLFLGKSRLDKNHDRLSLLTEIESTLQDYDQFIERTHRMLSFASAQPRDVESLRNWLGGTGCLAREETEYLTSPELMSLAPAVDTATTKLEAWIEDKLIRHYHGFRKGTFHDISNDPNVYIYSGPLIRQAAKALLLFLITILLLTPVVICNIINATSSRIVIVIASIISYLLILSSLTKSRTMELTLAGATYATVLIVFVSGTNAIQE
ncbi:hypothetical protein NPX13_g2818 [Xylaria arbuscula]|uniref:DUF6594 domain-containing protein n=1 Tax=Xylaria arbuscula TaxID=114810 RepID=A0A9W8TQR4_9PEZI|nr:hypothetical protein NPX13_g2818 [Xylaria arbuscula]